MAKPNAALALDLMEEATYLLRRASIASWAAYYLGTLPFLLGFLFFWADMGRNSTAGDHVAPAALGLAVLFSWMSAWQAVFSQSLRAEMTGTMPAGFSRLLFTAVALQPTKFVVLPVALLITIPFADAFAFYQNLAAVSYEERVGLGDVMSAARRQSRLWPAQNWLALGFVAVLTVVVLINIGLILYLVPQMLKTFLGFETALSRSQVLPLNTTFLAIAVALTYALVDPLIKAIYVVRCFYGESLSTGEDLKVQLRSLTAKLGLIAILLGCFATGYAQPAAGPASLDRSIDDVLKRPEFSWRLPHKHPPKEPKNWLTRALADMMDKLDHWSDQFAKWLHERFGGKAPAEPGKSSMPRLTVWVYVLLSVVLLVFIVIAARMFRKKPAPTPANATMTDAIPDVASEHTTADQLAPDEWLRTARDFAARNDLRLAVRALYLANLAYLGGRSLIAIDRSKSNSDYTRELRRRARSSPEILPIFGDTVGVFERSWYGMYEVDPALVEQLERNLSQTRARVEQ